MTCAALVSTSTIPGCLEKLSETSRTALSDFEECREISGDHTGDRILRALGKGHPLVARPRSWRVRLDDDDLAILAGWATDRDPMVTKACRGEAASGRRPSIDRCSRPRAAAPRPEIKRAKPLLATHGQRSGPVVPALFGGPTRETTLDFVPASLSWCAAVSVCECPVAAELRIPAFIARSEAESLNAEQALGLIRAATSRQDSRALVRNPARESPLLIEDSLSRTAVLPRHAMPPGHDCIQSVGVKHPARYALMSPSKGEGVFEHV